MVGVLNAFTRATFSKAKTFDRVLLFISVGMNRVDIVSDFGFFLE